MSEFDVNIDVNSIEQALGVNSLRQNITQLTNVIGLMAQQIEGLQQQISQLQGEPVITRQVIPHMPDKAPVYQFPNIPQGILSPPDAPVQTANITSIVR